MFEGEQKIREHAVKPSASGVIALVARDMEPFGFTAFVADDASAVVPIEQ